MDNLKKKYIFLNFYERKNDRWENMRFPSVKVRSLSDRGGSAIAHMGDSSTAIDDNRATVVLRGMAKLVRVFKV